MAQFPNNFSVIQNRFGENLDDRQNVLSIKIFQSITIKYGELRKQAKNIVKKNAVSNGVGHVHDFPTVFIFFLIIKNVSRKMRPQTHNYSKIFPHWHREKKTLFHNV